jgi:hypothetical protein
MRCQGYAIGRGYASLLERPPPAGGGGGVGLVAPAGLVRWPLRPFWRPL